MDCQVTIYLVFGMINGDCNSILQRTIGMFEQNNVGVRVQNPIAAFVRRMAPNDPSLMSLYQDVLKIQETIDGTKTQTVFYFYFSVSFLLYT